VWRSKTPSSGRDRGNDTKPAIGGEAGREADNERHENDKAMKINIVQTRVNNRRHRNDLAKFHDLAYFSDFS
jgi:hypothetical protein